jgi:uncharacterized protein (TIGR00369 family)
MRETVSPGPDETGVVPLAEVTGMKGLDFILGMIAGRYPQPPICATLGFRLAAAAAGTATFEGLPEARHYNPIGTVHGGFAATLLDSCMGCAVHTTLEAGTGYTTLELKVSLVRPITAGTGLVRAIGQVVHAGRRTATAEGRLLDAHGRLLAHGSTTCLLVPAEG